MFKRRDTLRSSRRSSYRRRVRTRTINVDGDDYVSWSRAFRVMMLVGWVYFWSHSPPRGKFIKFTQSYRLGSDVWLWKGTQIVKGLGMSWEGRLSIMVLVKWKQMASKNRLLIGGWGMRYFRNDLFRSFPYLLHLNRCSALDAAASRIREYGAQGTNKFSWDMLNRHWIRIITFSSRQSPDQAAQRENDRVTSRPFIFQSPLLEGTLEREGEKNTKQKK